LINTTNQYLTKIVPACLAEMHKDDGLVDSAQIEKWELSLKEIIKKMDNNEFNILMAQMVIKASGQGIVGLDLTGGVAWLKELRNS
jgi:hypothetical protein